MGKLWWHSHRFKRVNEPWIATKSHTNGKLILFQGWTRLQSSAVRRSRAALLAHHMKTLLESEYGSLWKFFGCIRQGQTRRHTSGIASSFLAFESARIPKEELEDAAVRRLQETLSNQRWFAPFGDSLGSLVRTLCFNVTGLRTSYYY